MDNFIEKQMDRVRDTKTHFANLYGVNTSSIVHCGDDKYIIVLPNGEEKRIGFNL